MVSSLLAWEIHHRGSRGPTRHLLFILLVVVLLVIIVILIIQASPLAPRHFATGRGAPGQLLLVCTHTRRWGSSSSTEREQNERTAEQLEVRAPELLLHTVAEAVEGRGTCPTVAVVPIPQGPGDPPFYLRIYI